MSSPDSHDFEHGKHVSGDQQEPADVTPWIGCPCVYPATVSAVDVSLKEQRMEYDDALTKQRMELVQEYEDKLTNTKVINIACQLSLRTQTK